MVQNQDGVTTFDLVLCLEFTRWLLGRGGTRPLSTCEYVVEIAHFRSRRIPLHCVIHPNFIQVGVGVSVSEGRMSWQTHDAEANGLAQARDDGRWMQMNRAVQAQYARL